MDIIMNISSFIKEILYFNLRNSFFIYNTASEKIAITYNKFLKNGVGVITCNKIACSSDYNNYKNLKILSINFNSPFLF